MEEIMKNIHFSVLLPLFLIGCAAAPSSYDSFSYRTNDFNETNISISEKGLSKEIISSILTTKFPPENEVSIAVMFLYSYNSHNVNKSGLSYYIMNEGKNINNVEKFVPVPRIFMPSKITFDNIQELGIRSLCEYTLLFYNNSNKSMTFSQFIRGEYKFESDIEFSLIDNQTTAVIASDRLYSSIIKKREFLNNNDIEEAEDEIYTLQAKLLVEKLNKLFDRTI
jgi:hypothetical protein